MIYWTLKDTVMPADVNRWEQAISALNIVTNVSDNNITVDTEELISLKDGQIIKLYTTIDLIEPTLKILCYGKEYGPFNIVSTISNKRAFIKANVLINLTYYNEIWYCDIPSIATTTIEGIARFGTATEVKAGVLSNVMVAPSTVTPIIQQHINQTEISNGKGAHGATSDNTANTLMMRDKTGKVEVTSIKGKLEGNADTADKLKISKKINGIAFDGTEDITIQAKANGGNADTVGGVGVDRIVTFLPLSELNTDLLNNSQYYRPYECAANEELSKSIGLSASWWHIKYMRHTNQDGFGMQIAYPLNNRNDYPRYRTSDGQSWDYWKVLSGEIKLKAKITSSCRWINPNPGLDMILMICGASGGGGGGGGASSAGTRGGDGGWGGRGQLEYIPLINIPYLDILIGAAGSGGIGGMGGGGTHGYGGTGGGAGGNTIITFAGGSEITIYGGAGGGGGGGYARRGGGDNHGGTGGQNVAGMGGAAGFGNHGHAGHGSNFSTRCHWGGAPGIGGWDGWGTNGQPGHSAIVNIYAR